MLEWFVCGETSESLCLNVFDAKKLFRWVAAITYWSDKAYVLCGPKSGENK